MNLTEAKNNSTISSMWVCMVDGKFLKSKQGKVGFVNKKDAVLAFKCSDYWKQIVQNIKNELIEMCHYYNKSCTKIGWNDKKQGKTIEDEKYNDMLANGCIKYIEITPVPDWINLKN